MTDCTNRQMLFPYCKHKPLTVNFKGGHISCDGEMLLVRQLDERPKIVDRVVAAVTDRGDQRYMDHDLMTLLRQRIYQMVAGSEESNEPTTHRTDPVFKLCCDRSSDPSDALYHCEGRTISSQYRAGLLPLSFVPRYHLTGRETVSASQKLFTTSEHMTVNHKAKQLDASVHE
jgi:hypothetical protein